MNLILVGFATFTIIASFYALQKWGLTAFLITFALLFGAFIGIVQIQI